MKADETISTGGILQTLGHTVERSISLGSIPASRQTAWLLMPLMRRAKRTPAPQIVQPQTNENARSAIGRLRISYFQRSFNAHPRTK